jgi:hypothetical protein
MFGSAHPGPQKPEVHGFHGDIDTTSSLDDARRTIAQFKKLGYVADLKVLHGVGHDFEHERDIFFTCIDKAVDVASAAPAP